MIEIGVLEINLSRIKTIYFFLLLLKYNLVTKNIRSLGQNKLHEIKIHIYIALHYRLSNLLSIIGIREEMLQNS